MTSYRLLARWLVAALLLMTVGFGPAVAQKQKQETPPVSRAVYWASAEPEVKVYLVGNYGGGDLLLTVVSQQEPKVVYHTSINSVEAVVKELTPVAESPGVRHYQFHHTFSKMTIWMALEFSIGGQKVPGLTRTFYDDIFTVAPNGHFNFNVRPKP